MSSISLTNAAVATIVLARAPAEPPHGDRRIHPGGPTETNHPAEPEPNMNRQ